MSLRDTRDIGTAKIVMLGGGGGGGSYSAGSGISISNSVITNIRKGALTGVIDSVSSNIAHTQITGARDTFAAGALILLQSEAAGTADNLRIQYGAQSSESQTFAIYDTSSTAASVTIASGDTVIMMIDNTGYRAIILNVLSASGGSSYAGLGIGKKTGVSSNVIDTDIDLHRAPIVGDRLLIYFDEKVTNPTGLKTYNNGVAVTSNLENATPLYINAGWNILQFMNDGLLYNNVWVRKQNVPVPSTLAGMSDTLIVSPSDDQLLVYDDGKWKNKKFIEANVGFPVTELRKIEVDGIVYDTDGMRTYEASNVANNKISLSVLNAYQFVQKVIAVNTGAHSGSSNGWSLYISDGMEVANVALTRADGSAFDDDISENELLLIYVDTAGNVARVLDIPVTTTEIKTVSGNPITLTDAVAGNAIEVSAEIVASQDLHGFDKPWVGGAGKNKLPMTVAGIKALNTSGTWSGNTYTLNGLTFALDVDNGGNVLGIDVTGTATDWASFNLYNSTISAGNYIWSNTGGVSFGRYLTIKSTSINVYLTNGATSASAQLTADTYNAYIGFNGGQTANERYEPMLRLSTVSDSTFAPYTNICPITGFSSVVITDVDAESHTATVTVSLGSTVYGGSLDLTSGELTITHANIASYNGETIGEPWISSMDEYTQGGTPTTGAQVVYTLATPTTTTLTAAQLALVKGYNQLTCNSGDMTLTYKASGLDALKERVDDLEDAVADLEIDIASKAEKTTIGTVESGTTASQPYAVGEHFIRNNKFCTCIATIASGATLTQGTNYVEGTIAENLSRATTYSSSETEIGTWNGQKLYRKVIDCGGMIQGTKYVSSGVSGAITVRHAFATAYSSTYQMPLPFLASGYEWSIGFGFVASTDAEHPNSVRLTCPSDQSTFSSVIAVIEYTKNS